MRSTENVPVFCFGRRNESSDEWELAMKTWTGLHRRDDELNERYGISVTDLSRTRVMLSAFACPNMLGLDPCANAPQRIRSQRRTVATARSRLNTSATRRVRRTTHLVRVNANHIAR